MGEGRESTFQAYKNASEIAMKLGKAEIKRSVYIFEKVLTYEKNELT